MNENKEVLVTVGIPTFNRPDGLRRTLEAITSQTYKNLEIIISDNCSTDEKVIGVVNEFLAKDARIIYQRHDENLGAVSNFFSLLKPAHGIYFMWAADDDWWDADFVKMSVKSLLKHEHASVTVSRFEPLPDPAGRIRRIPRYYDKIRKFENLGVCDRLLAYILQRDIFGKAHIIYGMFPTNILKQSVELLKSIVEPAMNINDFYKMDIFLNAIILSKGEMVITEDCLRKFDYSPRGGRRSFARVFRGVDPCFLSYINFMAEFIVHLGVKEEDKKRLLRALRIRKWIYFLERFGKKIIIYRLYWSVYKRFTFVKC